MVRHFEAITSNAIHGLAEFVASSGFIDHPRPFFEGRPMPDMLPMAAAQKSYPVAVLVDLESSYHAAHAAKSLGSSVLIGLSDPFDCDSRHRTPEADVWFCALADVCSYDENLH
jgi:hypothetical protein